MSEEEINITKYFVGLEYWEKDQNSTGYFWSEAINFMRSKGLNVGVIHPQPRSSAQDRTPYARYQSVPLRTLKKFILSAKIAVSILIKARKSDCVICGTNPELLLALLVLFQKLKRYQFVVLVHDVFPENALAAGVIKSESLVYRIVRRAFSWVYQQPDRMIVIGRDMKDFLEKKKRRAKPTVFIPNWVNHTDVIPMERRASALLDNLGWSEKIVFQFFGNIGRLQGIESLLKGIDQVDDPKAAFLFVGSGVQVSAVQEFCQSHPEKAVKYFESIPNATQSDVLAACDVALVSLSENMYGLGVPSKAYFAMASDRPILAVVDEGSEMDQMISKEQIGWVCRPGDPESFAQTVQKICDNGPNSIAGNPRMALLEGYSKDISLDQFVNVVKGIQI